MPLFSVPRDPQADARWSALRFCVIAGAEWLEGREPGWAERIDVHRLDQSDPRWSVLGQLYGPPRWFGGRRPRMSKAELRFRGFVAPFEPDPQVWAELTEVWRQEIAMRLTWDGPDPEEKVQFIDPRTLPDPLWLWRRR